MGKYWENRPDNQKITAETIAVIPDKELSWAMFDYIWYKVGDNYESLYRVLEELPVGYVVIYHLFVLDGEIGNGGFNQYFFNGLDQNAEQQSEALKLIEAPNHLQVLQEAFRIHDEEMKNEELQQLFREHTLESFSATYDITELSKCDDEWYALDKEFDHLLVQFVRNHLEWFVMVD